LFAKAALLSGSDGDAVAALHTRLSAVCESLKPHRRLSDEHAPRRSFPAGARSARGHFYAGRNGRACARCRPYRSREGHCG
jgi:hypothetical protein